MYAAWLADGRFILVLVAALLQMLLVTAVALAIDSWQLAAGRDLHATRYTLPATLLLLVGLVSFNGLSGVSIWVWLAILLPFGGGLALAYFVGEAAELRQVLRRAFVVDLPLDNLKSRLKVYLGWGETAVQDAVTIWEGEGGLLWLLALLVGLLVAGDW